MILDMRKRKKMNNANDGRKPVDPVRVQLYAQGVTNEYVFTCYTQLEHDILCGQLEVTLDLFKQQHTPGASIPSGRVTYNAVSNLQDHKFPSPRRPRRRS